MKTVATLTPEMKSMLVESFKALVESCGESDLFDCTIQRGVDNITKPGDNIEKYRVNETLTFSLLINGGAQDGDGRSELARSIDSLEKSIGRQRRA